MGSLFSAVWCLPHSSTVKQHCVQLWLPGMPSSALADSAIPSSIPRHQVFLQSGCSPTLLQLLCALPFEYFSNPRYDIPHRHPFIPSLPQSSLPHTIVTPYTIITPSHRHPCTVTPSHHHSLTPSLPHTITLTPSPSPSPSHHHPHTITLTPLPHPPLPSLLHTITPSHHHSLTPQTLPVALPLADRSMLPCGGKHEDHAAGDQSPAAGGLPARSTERGGCGSATGSAEGGRWA